MFSILLGPKLMGIRGEAWMEHPRLLRLFLARARQGSPWLVGRYAFQAPGDSLAALNINRRSGAGRFISGFVAFALSASLHSCGSHVPLVETRPVLPVCFFLARFAGCLGQGNAVLLLRRTGVARHVPKWLAQMTNFAFVAVFLHCTAPWLVEDLATGGVFIATMPFSILSWCGLGAKDTAPGSDWVFRRHGRHWWDTGIAV